jgi:hypothetical protein
MDGTGGSTAVKGDKKENTIPKDNYRFIPSISEQGLGEKPQRKKLQALFDKYLKPQQNESKTLDV